MTNYCVQLIYEGKYCHSDYIWFKTQYEPYCWNFMSDLGYAICKSDLLSLGYYDYIRIIAPYVDDNIINLNEKFLGVIPHVI